MLTSYGKRMALATIIVVLGSFAGRAAAEPVPFSQEPFTDIKSSHPNYAAIEYLRENNIIRGYLDGTFRPDNRISRAEFVMLITNPFFLQGEKLNECIAQNGFTEEDNIFFPDVRGNAWYADAVCIAKVKDLVNGYLDGTFKPGRPITFVEGAKIISNTFVLNVREEAVVWYEPYVEKLGEIGAIPTSIRTLNGLLTRGEAAEILYRVKTQTTSKATMRYADLKGRYE